MQRNHIGARIRRPSGLLLGVSLSVLVACGGGDTASEPADPATAPAPMTPPVVPSPGVILRPPVLSFSDTGISVSDGVTRIGAWEVSIATDWEYSFDQGATWIRGEGDWFEVVGDGPKTIWVRARDDFGNTSEIVMVSCVLDTTAPGGVLITPVTEGVTRSLDLAEVEADGRWEYSVDDRATWLPGTGSSLALLGNGLDALWLRQSDLAGNLSEPQQVVLDTPVDETRHEASSAALQPSVLTLGATRTALLHGTVVRGDADYIRWDIPEGFRLQSLRLVRYVSQDPVAFFAIQRAAVFDAGIDVSRMLVYGHMGPEDRLVNVVGGVPADLLGPGPMTLWFQQTGDFPTDYVIELVLETRP